VLGESRPNVIKDVPFEQNSLRVFQFKEILDDERTLARSLEAFRRIGIQSADESRLPWHPDQGLKHIVAPDGDVEGVRNCEALRRREWFPPRLQENCSQS
jgi:hypothetical protein